jgi:hypothetical protein
MMSKLRDIAYRIDPALWVREVLGVEPAGWQAEFLRAPLGASIVALTARQVGKTTAAAWAIAHYMLFTLEGFPPPETNSGQPPANENGRPLIASQPLAATSPTTPSAQGQTKPQSPMADEVQPGADRKPLQAVNGNSSVAVPPHAAALPVALSTLGPSPYPPLPEIKDVMDVGAQPKPPSSIPVARRAPKPPSSQVKGTQALPGASRRQQRPVNGEPVVARQSAAAAPASRSAAGQAPSSSSPKPSAGGQTKPTVNGQAPARRHNRAGPTTANTETSHQRGTPTSF